MKQPTMLAVLAAATATFLVAGCGNEQTNQASSLSPREEALKTYLEIQKAVADGDFNRFKNYLGPDFMAAANSGALTPEFQRLTVKYGGSLTKFFSGSAEFELFDEEGRQIRIHEIFQYKNGLVQKWPGKDLLKRVDEICAIRAEKEIKALATQYKREMIALAVQDGEDASEAEKEWNALPPHQSLERISHYLQDLCEFADTEGDSSKPAKPKYRIDITRYYDYGTKRPEDASQLRFRFESNHDDVGQEFTLQKFDDGTWKIIRR